jgi:hypothetical protein
MCKLLKKVDAPNRILEHRDSFAARLGAPVGASAAKGHPEMGQVKSFLIF